ncbi:hypothetical protein ACFL6S_19035 [Candidatus Poribacteria bacterium]
MRRWKLVHCLLVITALFLVVSLAAGQKNTVVPDLTKISDGESWKLYNREARVIKEDDKTSIYFEAKQGEGVAWLEDLEFGNGTIEVDIKGKDVQGRSFVGVAFRGVDKETYDAVYFRPFNFKSDDPDRRSHSVQYISHPTNTWNKLRIEHPNVYEKPVSPVPDPNTYFHARIVIEKPKVKVYVNDAKEPCLVVEELTERKGGWVGLWMGNGSDGTFVNLKVTPTLVGAEEEVVSDFSDLDPEQWVINPETTRFIEVKEEDGKIRRTLRVDRAEKQLTYLRSFEFTDGIIECDMRGGAYLGIAFRIREEGEKCEAFYFRPPEVEGWEHTIQYLARGMKNFSSWSWLRENYPGVYETELVPIPGPGKPGKEWWKDPLSEEWFHVKVTVDGKKAQIFVNNAETPSLVIEDLKHGENPGTVGVYAWRGEFANFTVQQRR